MDWPRCGPYSSFMAITVDSKRKLTYTEYCQIPEDGRRHEIIDGEHYASPAPDTYHQTLSRRLKFQLYRLIEETGRGQVFDAPTDLQLSEVDIVQPDLIVVLQPNLHIITPKKLKGVPDLVVEILSASTTQRDQGIKLELYQRSRVPEYWVVDPDEHLVAQHVLAGDAYQLRGQHAALIQFHGLDGVTVDLKKVW